MAKQRKASSAEVTVRGFYRVMLHDVRAGKKRYTPWRQNVITANGFQHYIVGTIGAVAGSKTISHMQLATQTTAPVSSQDTASGEFEARKATTNTFVANGTLRATASWNTNEATQSTLGGVALYNTSQLGVGTAGSIATFTTSNKTTDQTLNVTYEWRFS
jgi:hypothetical protein